MLLLLNPLNPFCKDSQKSQTFAVKNGTFYLIAQKFELFSFQNLFLLAFK